MLDTMLNAVHDTIQDDTMPDPLLVNIYCTVLQATMKQETVLSLHIIKSFYLLIETSIAFYGVKNYLLES